LNATVTERCAQIRGPPVERNYLRNIGPHWIRRLRVLFQTLSPNHIVSIREDRHKLAEYYDVAGKVPSQWEMYDRLKDPLETENLGSVAMFFSSLRME
jgi:hypothetical protein